MSKPDYLISTPENVDLHLELAGMGNRIFACLIDTLLSYAMLLLLGLACTLFLGLLEAVPMAERLRTIIDYCVLGLAIFLVLAVIFGYYIFFEGTWHGQTPGKKVARIRVIEQNGQPVSWPAVIIRNLVRAADTAVLLIGLLVMLIDRNERRLGDLAAGTLVIRERLPSEAGHEIRLGSSEQAKVFVDIGRVTPGEYDLLISFLSRRQMMSRRQRPLVARRLSAYFKNKLQEQGGPSDPERFLEDVYQAYRARA